jgi:gliding motility-associated protein GldL
MAGKKNPYGIGNVVSWGATIVIIGLLFKINHYKGANYAILAGLSVEAFLFLLLGFQREEKEIDWVRVYPELDEDFKGELPKSSIPVSAGSNFQSTAALDKMISDAKIGPELINSLGEGLRTFGDKIKAISRVTDASDATAAYTERVKQASLSYDKLSAAFDKASSSLAELANSSIDAQAYHDQVNNLAKNLSALNAVYELELQDSSAHLKSMNKFYHNMAATMQNFNESMEDSQLFKVEVGRLAKNLASLNSVYGNMLSAMGSSRA